MSGIRVRTSDAIKNFGARNIAISILLILISVAIITFGCLSFYSSVKENIMLKGELNAKQSAEEFDKYLLIRENAVMLAGFTVNNMANHSASGAEIQDFLTEETLRIQAELDPDVTGLYGYVKGEYLDGGGWVPDEDFDPVHRPWYEQAVAHGTGITLIEPYVDSQTGEVTITVTDLLDDGKSVVALDFNIDKIIGATEKIFGSGKDSFGVIYDAEGSVVLRTAGESAGGELYDMISEKIFAESEQHFEVKYGGSNYVVYYAQLDSGWYSVSVIDSESVYGPLRLIMILSALAITLTVFGLLAIFVRISKRNLRSILEEEEHKKAAESANIAKSEFLANMSHEIRTPIYAMMGMNGVILREATGENDVKVRTCAENIDTAGTHLLAIVNDILDISRIETGKIELVCENYSLSAMLSDISGMISFKADEKKLTFDLEVEDDLPDGLYGDETRVRQAINNLLSNAVKYTERGGVTLSVRRGSSRGDGMIDLTVAVSDTGIGIAEEDMGKLFKKFERIDLKRNSAHTGAGLGLAITKSLVEMMGGSVSVESEFGKGSVFTLVIPQKIVSDVPVGNFRERFSKSRDSADAYFESFHAPDAHILIVDDTQMNLTVAQGLLKNTRIHIDTALGGKEALVLTQSTAYDIIFLDQRMPEMDGIETLHNIRAQENGANLDTPVVCFTADAVAGAREHYLKEGFTDYLTKPVDAKGLEKAVLSFLPSDKVEFVRGQSAENAGETEGADRYASLVAIGVNTATGLHYCQNDDSFYRSILQEYAGGGAEKISRLNEFYDREDWKNYGILVHAIKSSSRMIGAAELSDLALRMEAAANEGKAEIIRTEHDNMISRYETIINAIHSVVEAPDAGSVQNGDDVLEFLPDD